MCGRYATRRQKQEIAERFRVKNLPAETLAPDYNIAPSTFQPIIRKSRETGEREMVLMRWGLIPRFAKSLQAFNGYSTINARAETILDTPTFRTPFLRHRGIAPMDFFYEWLRRTVPRFGKNGKQLKDAEQKIPFAFRPSDGGMFGVACVWDKWRDPAAEASGSATWLQSFAVITCEANELMSKIHDRMPVILHERDYSRWLDRESDPEQPPIDLLRPYPSELMIMEPCNPAVNSVRNNGPEMLLCPNPSEPASLLNSR